MRARAIGIGRLVQGACALECGVPLRYFGRRTPGVKGGAPKAFITTAVRKGRVVYERKHLMWSGAGCVTRSGMWL